MENSDKLAIDLSEIDIFLATEMCSNFYVLFNKNIDKVLIPQLGESFSEVEIEDLLPLNLNSYDFLKLLNILKTHLLD